MLVVGVLKMIDNDLMVIDYIFGFYFLVFVVTEVFDRLYIIVELYEWVMFFEVMGRDVGYIVLLVGIVGGVDVIFFLEIFYDLDLIVEKIWCRVRIGCLFSIVVVVEGVLLVSKDGVFELF